MTAGETAADQGLVRVGEAVKRFRTPEGGHVTPLDQVSLTIRDNEFLTLLGPSGCGKTTLLKAIAGFEDLDEGEIFLEGQPLSGTPAYRRPFNTVFQSYALFPHLTVSDNVGYGLDVAGISRDERDRRVKEALRLVSLEGLDRRMPRQLSGGQQQRVALTRALINRPRVLLLDEPLSALDRKLRQAMQIELKSLQHTVGITFLFVTHDQEEALTMSDRIAVMDRGQILQIGTPGEIYDTPVNRFVASFIGSSCILSGIYRGGTVKTAGGIDVQVGQRSIADGEAVDVVIRPEQLTAGSGQATLPITLDTIVFVGSDLHLHGRLADGTAISALQRHARGGSRFAPGETVPFGYDPAALHVMKSAPA